MDDDSDLAGGMPKVPMGLKITIMFLEFFGLAMGIVLMVLAFPLIGSLMIMVGQESLQAFLVGFGALAIFLAVLAMATASIWLARYLDRRPFPFAPKWKAGPPDHPARFIGMPALAVACAYGMLAALCTTPGIGLGDRWASTGFAAWIAIAFAAGWGRRRLGRVGGLSKSGVPR